MTHHAHHEHAIFELAERSRALGAAGLIIVGSAARGTARVDSDIDMYQVVGDGEYAQALATEAIAWVEPRPGEWENAYIDVKLTSRCQLVRAVDSADDAFRASLIGARVVHDRDGELADIVARITAPDEARFQRLEAAFADFWGLFAGYFLPQGVDRNDVVERRYAASQAAYAAVRIVLARDRILFRGHKYQREQAAAAPSGGPDFAAAIETLTAEGTVSAATAIATHIESLGIRTQIDDARLSRFIIANELSWYTGQQPPTAR